LICELFPDILGALDICKREGVPRWKYVELGDQRLKQLLDPQTRSQPQQEIETNGQEDGYNMVGDGIEPCPERFDHPGWRW